MTVPVVVGTLNLTVRDVLDLSLLEEEAMDVTSMANLAFHNPPTVSAIVPNSTRVLPEVALQKPTWNFLPAV